MTWNAYEVKIKSKTPTLIGYRNLGIITKTRYYIQGKNLWGMLTAYLTKNNLKGSICDWNLIEDRARDIDYTKVGEKINQYINFTYFYLYNPNKNTAYFPCYTAEGLKFGNLSKEKFEHLFISSYANTAIDRNTGTALEEMEEGKGSYHEVEFIKPDTEFIGYIFVNNNFTINGEVVNKEVWRQILEKAFKYQGLGGERNYGFGRFELIDLKGKSNEFTIFDSGIKINIQDNIRVLPKDDKSFIALAHVEADNNLEFPKEINGDFEPLVGMGWSSKEKKELPSKAKICMIPGTEFKNDKIIIIGNHGIWRIQ